MNTESLLNFLKYQQDIAGNELVMPADFDVAGFFQQLKGAPPQPQKAVVKKKPAFVPLEIKLPAPPKAKASPELNLPNKRPLIQLPSFANIEEIYAYIEKENIYQLEKLGITTDYPIVKFKGPPKAEYAVLTMVPSENDLESGHLLGGADGELLGKMLGAINIDFSNVFCTSVVKNPTLNNKLYYSEKNIHVELALRELATTGCKNVFLLGENCAQIVLKTGKSLKDLREQKHRPSKNNILNETDFWVIEHPQKLINTPGLKLQTWNDLKWIMTQL